MPGSGVTPATIQDVAAATGAHEFHASAKTLLAGVPAAKATEFDTPRWETDAAIVRELVARLHAV